MPPSDATPAEPVMPPSQRRPMPRVVKVEPRRVLGLTVLFTGIGCVLLAWLLESSDPVLLLSVPTLLVFALSVALAYTLARQHALATTLQNAVDNLPLMLAYVDRDQRILFNNRAWFEAYAHAGEAPVTRASSPVNDLHGQPLRSVLGEPGYARAHPPLVLAMTGQRQDFELHLETAVGPRDLAVTYVPDVHANQQVKGVYVLFTDIAARKAAEQREHDQLLSLAEVSRLASIGEITSEIAHQVNQPLAAIAMFSNAAQRTLESGGDPGKLGEWMANINAQSKRASDVIQRLRRFAHQGEIHTSALDLNTSVREAIALAEAELRSAKVTLNLQLSEPLPKVQASTILIEQVVYNLLHNAIQASGVDGVVTIESRSDEQQVWLEIFDSSPADAANETDLHSLGQTLSRNILALFHGDMISTHYPQGGRSLCLSLPRSPA